MKLETLDLIEEQKLFCETTEPGLGYLGSVKIQFVAEGLRDDVTAFPGGDALHYEYEELIAFLQSEDGCFLLKDQTSLEAFCADHFRSHIPFTFNRECWGFRVLTELRAWYIACTPWHERKQATIYVYQRIPLMTTLAAARGLPESCYGVLPFTGERICIRFGTPDFERFPQYGTDAKANAAFAEEKNAELKVSRAQRAAMECGVMYGWHHPYANPRFYDGEGYYVGESENENEKRRKKNR